MRYLNITEHALPTTQTEYTAVNDVGTAVRSFSTYLYQTPGMQTSVKAYVSSEEIDSDAAAVTYRVPGELSELRIMIQTPDIYDRSKELQEY